MKKTRETSPTIHSVSFLTLLLASAKYSVYYAAFSDDYYSPLFSSLCARACGLISHNTGKNYARGCAATMLYNGPFLPSFPPSFLLLRDYYCDTCAASKQYRGRNTRTCDVKDFIKCNTSMCLYSTLHLTYIRSSILSFSHGRREQHIQTRDLCVFLRDVLS